ncbi:MAG: hypothetical protein MUF15_08125 [Acidobacteria bacterium]|jgi:hypothetical protein|nr:hypothetical protein [Acidobacteriota bacterium]
MQQLSIKSRIDKELDILSVHLQKKVLDYVVYLTHTMPPRIRDGKKLTKLAGLITHEEAEELTEIINTGCEQIDNEC